MSKKFILELFFEVHKAVILESFLQLDDSNIRVKLGSLKRIIRSVRFSNNKRNALSILTVIFPPK